MKMRRRDHEMSREFAEKILDECEWAVIAMLNSEGNPHCIPITIAREGDAIYFHSGKRGEKVECMRANPKICLTCVGYSNRPEHMFTAEFESAVVHGTVSEVTDEAEKTHAMRLICQRHTPRYMHEFEHTMAKQGAITLVWKLTIEDIAGKHQRFGPDGKELPSDLAAK